jgi:hypothetical protein
MHIPLLEEEEESLKRVTIFSDGDIQGQLLISSCFTKDGVCPHVNVSHENFNGARGSVIG